MDVKKQIRENKSSFTIVFTLNYTFQLQNQGQERPSMVTPVLWQKVKI